MQQISNETDSGRTPSTGNFPNQSGQQPFNQGPSSSKPTGDGQQSLTEQAKQTTSQVVDKVQEQASSRFEEQKQTAVDGLSSVADAMRQAGKNLKEQDQG